MSLLKDMEVKKAVWCDRCGKCLGPCPNCGAYLDHDESHAAGCTAEEDYDAVMAAMASGEFFKEGDS